MIDRDLGPTFWKSSSLLSKYNEINIDNIGIGIILINNIKLLLILCYIHPHPLQLVKFFH